MMNRVHRLLAVALASTAALIGFGCKSIPFFGGAYNLEIRPTANVANQLQSLYVIVAPKREVQEQLLSESKYKDLLQDDRLGKYTSFIQYEPTDGPSWKMVYQGQLSSFVEHEVDGESIEVEVDSDLISNAGGMEFSIVVLAFFGTEGFEQVTVGHPSIDAKLDQLVEVQSGSLNLRDV